MGPDRRYPDHRRKPSAASLPRALAGALVVLLAAGPVVAAGAADGVPDTPGISAARRRLAAVRAQAQEAAEAYQHAEQDLLALEDEIRVVAGQLPPMRARLDHARRALAQRAAVMYRSRGTLATPLPLLEVFESEDLLGAVRVKRLAASVNESTDHDAAGLAAEARALEGHEGDLRDRRERQARLVEIVERRVAELDAAVAEAAATVRRLEQQEAMRRWLEAQAAAAAAAALQPPPPAAGGQRAPTVDVDVATLIPVGALLCPVDSPVTFTNDWGQPRSDWRVHQGTDVFAPRGSPNVALNDGVVEQRHGGKGGNAVWLTTDDGHQYYYAHLERFAGDFAADGTRRVHRGEVIGYSGNTGNAASGPVHTHFEIHPGGAGAVNPYRALLVMCARQRGV